MSPFVSEIDRRRALSLLATTLSLGLMTLGFAACQPQGGGQGQQAAVDTAAIQSKLDSLGRLVSRANRTGDAELFASTWAKEGIMSGAGQPLVRRRDSIVAAFKQRPPLPPGAKMTIHPIEMRVLSGQWAYAFGVDSLTYTPDGAAEPVTETSTFLVLIRKTPEGWKTYREVLSANGPPPGTE
jgi:ketosteroid isomerase-like protein